jgi:hypothetical protein
MCIVVREHHYIVYCYLLSVVLNEKQRTAKRKLIDENRERRKIDDIRVKQRPDVCAVEDRLTDNDRALIAEILFAYERTSASEPQKYNLVSMAVRHCRHYE